MGEGRKLVGDSQKLSVQLPPLASNTHGALSKQISAGNDRYEARSEVHMGKEEEK